MHSVCQRDFTARRRASFDPAESYERGTGSWYEICFPLVYANQVRQSAQHSSALEKAVASTACRSAGRTVSRVLPRTPAGRRWEVLVRARGSSRARGALVRDRRGAGFHSRTGRCLLRDFGGTAGLVVPDRGASFGSNGGLGTRRLVHRQDALAAPEARALTLWPDCSALCRPSAGQWHPGWARVRLAVAFLRRTRR